MMIQGKTLVTRKVERYVKEGGRRCPFGDCRSYTLSCECVLDSEEGIDTDIKCRTCGRQWTEHYRISSITITGETSNDASEPAKEGSAE